MVAAALGLPGGDLGHQRGQRHRQRDPTDRVTAGAHLHVHLIADNYGTHKTPAIKAWLAGHPRFTLHHTPTYSSWLNQVERWFAYLTEDLLHRNDHRSDHRSVQALEADIRAS